MIATIFYTYFQGAVFSYEAKRCNNAAEMLTVIKKYKHLYIARYIDKIEYLHVIHKCIENNYDSCINIILYNSCPILLFNVFLRNENHVINSITTRFSEKKLIKLYVKNEDLGFFTYNYDWLHYAITYRKKYHLYKILIDQRSL